METTLERDDVRLLATPAEAATALAISRKTLDRMVKESLLQPVRLFPGDNRRFRWGDVAALATDNQED